MGVNHLAPYKKGFAYQNDSFSCVDTVVGRAGQCDLHDRGNGRLLIEYWGERVGAVIFRTNIPIGSTGG
ncbi:hypothetical protein BIFGAL_02932 [Bifidobacterium gallicum DSM 20093 = LMG 11596]|uniref:Uncharacterized protein n=1 Tax=Bifidobacterium gallicum DSM 20093 = LMG 11596 TaxID=561180 RepID=D1NT21_9BIFI|nr:hypothetical protein BIFGAL_02932 [Bifidobacterium gallicum DSM 20093 = LMG 11596]